MVAGAGIEPASLGYEPNVKPLHYPVINCRTSLRPRHPIRVIWTNSNPEVLKWSCTPLHSNWPHPDKWWVALQFVSALVAAKSE